jgi:SPP1 gp7 family putative phage head morphogenesis protein
MARRPKTGSGRAPNRPTPERMAVKFTEAIEALRRRLDVERDEWHRLLEEEEERATSVAEDVLRAVTVDLMAAVLKAMESGGTIEDFRRDYDRIVVEHGWSYHGNAGWHSQLIYRMHTSLSHAAGRWEQGQRLEAARPGHYFGRLVTVGDHRVRDSHAQMHGIIRPIADPYWLTHWPPNGFNCRCYAQVVSKTSMAGFGWVVTPEGESRLLVPPDAGWGMRVDR